MISWIINGTLGVLVALSIATWSIAIIKYRRFRKSAQENLPFEQSYFEATTPQEQEKRIRESSSELALLAAVGIAELKEIQTVGGVLAEQRDGVERKLTQLSHEMLSSHEAGLSELASIGTLAPFVGLFGTVWGIKDALKTIAASGNATIETVSGPVGEALITTAIGIMVALPAAAFYNYFSRQVKLRAVKLDQFGERFLKKLTIGRGLSQ
jgi:biopolymer transport protein ExbB